MKMEMEMKMQMQIELKFYVDLLNKNFAKLCFVFV